MQQHRRRSSRQVKNGPPTPTVEKNDDSNKMSRGSKVRSQVETPRKFSPTPTIFSPRKVKEDTNNGRKLPK